MGTSFLTGNRFVCCLADASNAYAEKWKVKILNWGL